jgi:predicted peptidase
LSRPRAELAREGPLPYLLRLPADERPGPAPVLCFLHGYDEGAPTEIRTGLCRHGPLRRDAPDDVHEFIIIAPQLPLRGDVWLRFSDEVAAIVRAVQQRHAGDPARTALTGFSFGGNGVFDLAVSQRSLWSALWPVDPTRCPSADPGLPVWLSSGELSRRRRSEYVRTLRLDARKQAGAGTRVYEDAGADHVGTAAVAYGDPRIYQWILTQRRAPAP